jgi:uncharacterized linocin/CFP29 family protein
MSHLLRDKAPITEAAWEQVDEEARERLKPALAARKLIDFAGPRGWRYSATSLGRTEALGGALADGLSARQRRVLPMVEVRAPFTVARSELGDADRGAEDVDFATLDEAARTIAVAENKAIFHGWGEAGIEGIIEASAQDPIALGEDCERYPRHVAKAVESLLAVGIDGPHGLAMGPETYTRVLETSQHGGYPLLDHLRQIVHGPLVWAPGVEGAAVISVRGGDFLFESGEDISVGYESHDADAVNLYLEQSFSFRVVTPEAAVALTP